MFGSPGSSFRSIPSRPAARTAVAARYGLHDPSMVRSSIAPRPRDPQHLRAVVVAVRDPDGRPRGARGRRAELQPLVRVDRRRRERRRGAGVCLEAADEVVRRLREAEAARVVLVEERVVAVPPERHVEVAAVAREVRERLRHERREQPLPLRERVHHVAEEDRAVAADERVVVGEVLLELPVRVLVVVRVVPPPELVHVAGDRRQEVVVPREAAEVVAGLLEVVERVGELQPAVVAAAEEEVLELEADLELEAGLARPGELVPENRARVVRPRLALDRDVAGEPGDGRLPGDRREAVEVGDRGDVGVARHLADVARREAGEPGAVVDQVVEVGSRDQLRARACVEVDELGEEELDPAVGDVLPDLLETLVLGHGDTLLVGSGARLYHAAPAAFTGRESTLATARLCPSRTPAAAARASPRSRSRASRRPGGRGR